MEVAGLAFGVAAAIDLAFEYGKILVKTCATFKNAHTEVHERVLSIRSRWIRTRVQLEFLKRVWKSLDDEHQETQVQIIQLLNSKLSSVNSQLDRAAKKKWKYVLMKESLDEAIEDLAAWQRIFDPSWFLILKISSPLIDQELTRNSSPDSSVTLAHSLRDTLRLEPMRKIHVFLPEEQLKAAQIHDIQFASARLMQMAGSNKCRIIDSIPVIQESDLSIVTKDVRELATRLNSVDPLTFGVLQCLGVVPVRDAPTTRPSSFILVLKVPKDFSNVPRSLRDYLLSGDEHTLTQRCNLAKQLATAVSFVHTLGFVHKNVRPENILGFQKDQAAFGSFFLTGFEAVRMADGRTRRLGDPAWERNVYRHPHRQGLNPEADFVMQHDIYSLGVCLLEIGMWESFVIYDNTGARTSAALGTDIFSIEFENFPLKDRLVALAKRHLPKRIGERYCQVVVNCLTCLDKDNTDFGDQSEFEDEDGVLIGVKYIQKIMLKLDEINI